MSNRLRHYLAWCHVVLNSAIPFFVSDLSMRWPAQNRWLTAQLLALEKIRLMIRLAWQYCPQLRCPRQAAVSMSKNNHNLFCKSISIRKSLNSDIVIGKVSFTFGQFNSFQKHILSWLDVYWPFSSWINLVYRNWNSLKNHDSKHSIVQYLSEQPNPTNKN